MLTVNLELSSLELLTHFLNFYKIHSFSQFRDIPGPLQRMVRRIPIQFRNAFALYTIL